MLNESNYLEQESEGRDKEVRDKVANVTFFFFFYFFVQMIGSNRLIAI